MCGIAGVVTRDPLEPQRLEQLSRMSDGMIHRGPDGAGTLRDSHVALAVRRLSIIDLATGWQPLHDEEGALALICNGEIYNHVEVREQLKQRGHVFATGSDCEVILHLYQERGADCVHDLRGMFAFALWDKRRQVLLLARDRMGEKPLYVYERDGLLVFASELKMLLDSGVAPFEIEPRAIDQFFHYHYVPEPSTPIRHVRKLPAGHLLTVSLTPWSVRENCYWRMEDAPPLDGDPIRAIRAELETISEITIRSDVPVGIALSGGLDSSTIAALATRKYPGTMHAFSAGYSSRPHSDERTDARDFAQYLGMPFHEVEISTSTIVERYPEVIRWQDDPFADLSSFGYWMVASAARDQGIPVLLQGQGGDELFWGYPWVTDAVRHTERKARIDPSNGPRLGDYLELTLPSTWRRRGPFDWMMSLAGLRSSWEHYQRDLRNPRDQMVFYDLTQHYRLGEQLASGIYPAAMKEAVGVSTAPGVFTMPRPWPRIDIAMTRLVCQTYLLENGMARGDRLSMASSVELRLPFVDYRLVETVIGLRKARTDVALPPKAWLKEAVRDLLPDWVLRRRKRGFQPPVRAWHRALFDRYGSLLRDGTLVQLGILRPEAAERLSPGPYPLSEVESFSLTALALELWCRQWRSPS
jgi:asparagine synthase (glutamine-hydrolysing)